MKNKYPKQYCKALVIVHGASELQIAKYVKSKLRLPLEYYSRDNGKTSIQINGLMDVLNNNIFRTPTNFFKKYDNIEHHKNTPYNFRIFTIMDTDDCNEKTLNQYSKGSLFEKHWLSQYIIPIYNIPNLEDILIRCNMIDKPLSDKEKIPTYSRIFPVVSDISNSDEIKKLKINLEKCDTTNMNYFLEYCLNWAEEIKIKF